MKKIIWLVEMKNKHRPESKWKLIWSAQFNTREKARKFVRTINKEYFDFRVVKYVREQ